MIIGHYAVRLIGEITTIPCFKAVLDSVINLSQAI